MKNNMWAEIEARMDRGEYPAVYVTADGHLGLDGAANGATLPQRLAAKMPCAMVEAARARQAERHAAEAKASADRAEQYRRESVELVAKIAAMGQRRVWGLAGFFVEEMTGAMASWSEVSEFEGCFGVQQFPAPCELYAVAHDESGAETMRVPLYRFFDLAGVKNRHQRFDFVALVKKFAGNLAEQRERQAAVN